MAQFNKQTYVKLVEQMCIYCIYDPGCGGGSWRAQVKACTSVECPLYGIRPLPLGEKHENAPLIPNLGKQRREEWSGPTKWSN